MIVTTTDVQIKPNSSSQADANTPLITVLNNQKAVDGGIWVDGQEVQADINGTSFNGSTLYYGGNGYQALGDPFSFVVAEGNRTGNWSAISTSTAGESTVSIFSAYTIIPSTTFSYALYPATSPDDLAAAQANPTYTIIDDGGVIGVAGAERLSLVFWPGGATSVTVDLEAVGDLQGTMQVSSDQPAAYLFAMRGNGDGSQTLVVTLADPSQALDSLNFGLTSDALSVSCSGEDDGCQAVSGGITVDVALPTAGLAGSSAFIDLILKPT